MNELTKTFRREGFCVARNLVPSPVPLQVLKDVDELYRLQLGRLKLPHVPFTDESTVLANMARLLEADVNVYLSAARHIAKLLSVQDLMCHENIRKVVLDLGIAFPSIPTSPVVNVISEQLRIPGGYYGVNPHQDWPSIQGSLDAVVVWTPLMDVPADRFPVQIIPGSHMQGLWEGVDSAYAREIPAAAWKEEDFVSVAVNRGDVIFFTVFTVHRTGLEHQGKPCNGLRIGCNFRYENTADPTFVERDFYCAYKRSVARGLVTPDFPRAEQVAALFSE